MGASNAGGMGAERNWKRRETILMINGKNGDEESREERKYERGKGIKKKLSEKEND